MNFIKQHLIIKILDISESVYNLLSATKYKTFIYFDNPIVFNTKQYDRIKDGLLYEREQIIPNKLPLLNGGVLIKVFKELKKKNVYIYKEMDGKFYKIRPKNR